MKTITPSAPRAATHAAHAHPEASERPRTQYWQIDPDLREQLASLKHGGGLSNDILGKRLGMADGTVVSKYLNDRMDRDPSDFERRLRDLLAGEERRRDFGGEIVTTNVVTKIGMFIDRVRATGRVGVFTGEAGIGKTVGAQVYVDKNPTAILLTINAIQNNATGVKQLLWGAAGPSAPLASESHFSQLVRKLAGSQRPLIVDNAQRLGAGGRSFLFDFHDATACPMVLLGNPVILRQIARIDQEHSRTARQGDAQLKDPEKVTRRILAQYVDDPETIMDLAIQVVQKPRGGHLRALGHLLAEMRTLMELPQNAADPRGSFLKALAASIDHSYLAA